MSVGTIAKEYKFSFAGVAKHLDVMERSGLVRKTIKGKEHIVCIDPKALREANKFIEQYEELWEKRLDSLEDLLNEK